MPSDYIYGIGNEVLTVAILVLSGLIPLLAFLIRKTDWRALLNSVGTGHWWIFSEHRNPGANVQEIGNRLENVEPGKTLLISDTAVKINFQIQCFKALSGIHNYILNL
ncbi:hypothetical protein Cfor_01661 [Coptotermes formosanus]|uniref:Uncharacterized protein n=1 Tax=Coptotermes formosanus TaxID=36987 RepID=A0A6L2Q755_COPFO|nr:hypothetical protein Cfor_01661 [Coptotermes formosanus]